jgi:hypothetical protein
MKAVKILAATLLFAAIATAQISANKLTIKTLPQPGRTVAFDKMAGAIDTDKGRSSS